MVRPSGATSAQSLITCRCCCCLSFSSSPTPGRSGALTGGGDNASLSPRPLNYPVRPNRRSSTSQQRGLAEHGVHKVLDHWIVQVGVRRKNLAAAGIGEF